MYVSATEVEIFRPRYEENLILRKRPLKICIVKFQVFVFETIILRHNISSNTWQQYIQMFILKYNNNIISYQHIKLIKIHNWITHVWPSTEQNQSNFLGPHQATTINSNT